MITLIGYWEEAEAFKKDKLAIKKLYKMWTHACKSLGVDKLIMIGKNVPIIGDLEIQMESYLTYEEAREACSGTPVVITESGTPIKKFKHPKNDTVYIVGDNYNNPKVLEGDLTVGIDAKIPLHDIIAASIVLHSRGL